MNLTSRGDNLWIMAVITMLRVGNGCDSGSNRSRSSRSRSSSRRRRRRVVAVVVVSY